MMKHRLTFILLAAIIAFFGCGNSHSSGNKDKSLSKKDKSLSNKKNESTNAEIYYINNNDSNSQVLIARGNKIEREVRDQIGVPRTKILYHGGTVKAFQYCSTRAMLVTDSIANVEGVQIKRLAKKNRNPENAMNDEESLIFKQYIIEYLGKKPLEPKLSINQEGHPVYYKPIYVYKSCLKCHGSFDEDISPEIQKMIAEKYPDDKAVDFKKKQPRGMIAITFPEITAQVPK